MTHEPGGDRSTDPGEGSPGHGVGPFVEAVIDQISRGVDQVGPSGQQRVDALADRLATILIAFEQGVTEPALATLVEDPLLLSSFFQNVDLLYAHAYPHADAVSMLTLEAIHLAVEAEEEG